MKYGKLRMLGALGMALFWCHWVIAGPKGPKDEMNQDSPSPSKSSSSSSASGADPKVLLLRDYTESLPDVLISEVERFLSFDDLLKMRSLCGNDVSRVTQDQFLKKYLLLMNSSDENVRANAVRALADGMSPNAMTSQIIINALSEAVRESSKRDSSKRGSLKVHEAALQAMEAALDTLGKLIKTYPNNEKLVDLLVDTMKDKDSNIRIRAIRAVGKSRSSHEKILDGVLAASTDPEYLVRTSAIESLGNLGKRDPKNNKIIHALKVALQDSSVRLTAAYSLMKFVDSTDVDLTNIVNALSRTALMKPNHTTSYGSFRYNYVTQNERSKAVKWLYRLGKANPNNEKILLTLAGIIGESFDDNGRSRYLPAEALIDIKSTNKKLHLVLANILKEHVMFGGANEAAEVLSVSNFKKSGKEVYDVLTNALYSRSHEPAAARTVCSAAKALGKNPTQDKTLNEDVNRALIYGLGHREPSVRWAVAKALGNLRPSDKGTHLALADVLFKDKDKAVREVAKEALRLITLSHNEIYWDKRIYVALHNCQDQGCDVRSFIEEAFRPKAKPVYIW